MKYALAAASALLLVTMGIAAWKLNQGPSPVLLVPTLSGQAEYCLTCHGDLPVISRSHPLAQFGCVSCHGGERLALTADLAHSTLRGGANPSDLTVVEASCGGDACHSGAAADQRDQIARLLPNLHATYAGAIAIMRYQAGAQPDLLPRQAIAAVEVQGEAAASGVRALATFDPAHEQAPSLQAFAENCLFCHLSAPPLPGAATARFSGCAACHSQPADGDLKQTVHRLNTDIAYDRCNACHQRGMYDAQTVQFQPRRDQPTKRQEAYYLPGTAAAKCEFRLDCIDCHTRREIMGDGNLYGSQAQARDVECRTCHGDLAAPPLTRTIGQPDDLALRLAAANLAVRLEVGDTIVITPRGEPLWNIRRLADGRFELVAKATGQHHIVPLVQGSGCQQNAAQQEAKYCHACHAS